MNDLPHCAPEDVGMSSERLKSALEAATRVRFQRNRRGSAAPAPVVPPPACFLPSSGAAAPGAAPTQRLRLTITVCPSSTDLTSAPLQSYVDDGSKPSSHVAVARCGKVIYDDCYGYMDLESKTPIRDDAIYRLASMTKPITCVAAMICYERGCFQLDDPLSKYCPEWASTQVILPSFLKYHVILLLIECNFLPGAGGRRRGQPRARGPGHPDYDQAPFYAHRGCEILHLKR